MPHALHFGVLLMPCGMFCSAGEYVRKRSAPLTPLPADASPWRPAALELDRAWPVLPLFAAPPTPRPLSSWSCFLLSTSVTALHARGPLAELLAVAGAEHRRRSACMLSSCALERWRQVASRTGQSTLEHHTQCPRAQPLEHSALHYAMPLVSALKLQPLSPCSKTS